MNFVGKVAQGVKDFFNEINLGTLMGVIDVVVVKQEDSSQKCSPFCERFCKLGVIRSKEKVVYIEINGELVDMHMEFGEADNENTPTAQLTNESTASDSAMLTPTPSSNEILDETGYKVRTASIFPIEITDLNDNVKSERSNILDSKVTTPTAANIETSNTANYFSNDELTPELISPVISQLFTNAPINKVE
jgi:hypothetical protein